MRFATKLTLTLALCASLPLVIGGYLWSQARLATIQELSRDVYLSVTGHLVTQLEYQTQQARALAEQVGTTLNTPTLSETAALERMSTLLAEQPFVSAVGLYTEQGQLIDVFARNVQGGSAVEFPPIVPAPLMQVYGEAQARGISSVVAKPMMWSATMPMVVPIASKTTGPRMNGIVIAVVGHERLHELVSATAGRSFGQRGDVYLADATVHLVAHSQAAYKDKVGSSLAHQGIFSVTSPKNNGQQVGISIEYNGLNGEPMLGTLTTLPETGLSIVVEQPQRVAYSSVRSMQRFIVFGGVISGIVAALLGIVIGRSFHKPLSQLSAAANDIAAEHFATRLPEGRTDEFGVVFRAFNQAATELERYKGVNIARLLAERNKLQGIIQQNVNGIIVFNADGTVAVANPVFLRWFSLQNTPLEGKQAQEILAMLEANPTIGAAIQPLRVALQTALQPDAAPLTPVQVRLLRVGEAQESVLQGVVTTILGDGDTRAALAYLCTLRDATKEVEIDRMKTELVAIVAHELRSPLTSIKGFSDLIAMKMVSAEDTPVFAQRIAEQADKLNATITKFLDVSRMESGATQLQRFPFFLHDVVRSVIEVNEPLAAEKHIRIVQEIAQTKPLLGDPDVISQAVLNFFSNAIKYSPNNTTITVTVKDQEHHLYFAVKDEGYGISSSAQEKLFTKFFRATDDERVSKAVGTGLGLAFTKEIIEHHGGTLGVESRLHEGSTFWFTLPK